MLAVLDANVLFPFHIRNLLLHLAAGGLYEPVWSDEIMEEARRNLLIRGRVDDVQWARLDRAMRKGFGDAWIDGYQHLIDDLTLPDQNDRHVLAVAIFSEADLIVTENTKDFPATTLAEWGIARQTPRQFAEILWARNPAAVFDAAEKHRLSLTKNPISPAQYLDTLRETSKLRALASHLERAGFLDPR